MTESLGKVGDKIVDGARATKKAIAESPSRIRHRNADEPGEEDPAELNP